MTDEIEVTSNLPLRFLMADIFEAVRESGYEPTAGPEPLEQTSGVNVALVLLLALRVAEGVVDAADRIGRASLLAKKVAAVIRRKAPGGLGEVRVIYGPSGEVLARVGLKEAGEDD
jgi:hypothetical protein